LIEWGDATLRSSEVNSDGLRPFTHSSDTHSLTHSPPFTLPQPRPHCEKHSHQLFSSTGLPALRKNGFGPLRLYGFLLTGKMVFFLLREKSEKEILFPNHTE
jgi:hypothetical protein